MMVFATQTNACFILCLNDDNTFLVGNHEDWFAKDAAIRIIPPSQHAYGSVVFTFMTEGWAQGGMNEKGLFFDGAFTPFQEIEFDSQREKHPGYVWQAMLNECATVAEALTFLARYTLPDLEEAHIVLADAKGNAVTLGVNNGAIAIKHREGNYLLQTNFNPWQPELSDEATCPRYETAKALLQSPMANGREMLLNTLKATHQDTLTVYSNIYDLSNRTITTYVQRQFNRPLTVRLPEVFQYGSCTLPLAEITNLSESLATCSQLATHFTLKGSLRDADTGDPIPYANIGILDKNRGTLSEPDGTFELVLPQTLRKDTLRISCIGYAPLAIPIQAWQNGTFALQPDSKVLEEVRIEAKRSTKVARLGWMSGRDGIVPFDTLQGGAVAALLLELPASPVWVQKIQFRLLYNSKDTLRFRLHFFTYDSLNDCPGEELLHKEIVLEAQKRFGWVRIDLEEWNISLLHRKLFVGFEWMDTQSTRMQLLKGLSDWQRWKAKQFAKGNAKVELLNPEAPPSQRRFKYHGNMMNWPGFDELPPWTGLMIETGKHEKTAGLRTFQRKTSFGKWEELDATLNAVLVVRY